MKEHTEKKEQTEEEDQITQANAEQENISPPPAQDPFPSDPLEDLQKQHAELKDQYLRKVADFDNYRKRMVREKQEVYDYANTGILTDLIAILDDFDRALAAGTASDQNSVVDGIKMINKQMRGLLEAKYNLVCYAEVADVFDPNIHEAIARAFAPVAEPTLAEVYLKGYKLRDRVIRAAKVLVNMPDGNTEAHGEDMSEASSGETTRLD